MCSFQKEGKRGYEYRMEIKKKPTALILAGGYLLWDLLLKPIWNLNVERLAESRELDQTLSGGNLIAWADWLASYIPNSFGIGFVSAALLFAYWDIIQAAFRRHVLRQVIPEAVNDAAAEITAWVGCIAASFDLEKQGYATLRLSIISVGSTPFRIAEVRGYITLKYVTGSNRRTAVKLPPPSILNNPSQDGAFERGHTGQLWLAQAIPHDVAREMPDLFSWSPYPSYEFENLEIVLRAEDDPNTTKRLKLWHSMRLSAGEGKVRCDETMKLFQSEGQAKELTDALAAVARHFKS